MRTKEEREFVEERVGKLNTRCHSYISSHTEYRAYALACIKPRSLLSELRISAYRVVEAAIEEDLQS